MATYAQEPRGVGFSAAGTFGGTLAAIGMLALIAGIVTAVGAAIGIDIDFTDTEWRQIGWGGAAALAIALLASFLFGGYIAGRMALGSGVRHGVWVFVLGLVIFGVAWLLTWALVGTDTIVEGLEDADVPTSRDAWIDIGIGATIAGGVAMLIGSLFGAITGARWRPPTTTRYDAHEEREIDLREDRTERMETDGDGKSDRELSVEEERELARHGRSR